MQRKDPNRDRELGGMFRFEDISALSDNNVTMLHIPRFDQSYRHQKVWTPVAFEYPEVTPCPLPTSDVKPVPYTSKLKFYALIVYDGT